MVVANNVFIYFGKLFEFSAKFNTSDLGMKARINGNQVPGFDPNNFYKSNYYSRGFQWNLYSMLSLLLAIIPEV